MSFSRPKHSVDLSTARQDAAPLNLMCDTAIVSILFLYEFSFDQFLLPPESAAIVMRSVVSVCVCVFVCPVRALTL